MLLIYTKFVSPRLDYICTFIFGEVLGISFLIISDKNYFKNYKGCKINYTESDFTNAFNISPHSILFETDIKPQTIETFKNENDVLAFFKTDYGDFPFDIFAATFYLISRYEEYLPHTLDEYGRYAHQNSLAYKNNFLQIPIINIWVNDFATELKKQFNSIKFLPKAYSFLPTYDIDMAWSYKNKGLLRNVGGFVKKPTISRLKTLLGLQKDPFDCYTFLQELHTKYKLLPIYFILVAEQNGQYDKNILPSNLQFQQLIQLLAQQFSIGLHPSWSSNNKMNTLKNEKQILEKITNSTIKKSRQHYIKFSLPHGYQQLLDTGILEDYSMGYGSINGFRASVASPFFWYNLKTETTTALRIYPFCFMDANCFYEQKLTLKQSYEELLHYYNIVHQVHGQFIPIFHNSFLGNINEFKGWLPLYQQFIAQVEQ